MVFAHLSLHALEAFPSERFRADAPALAQFPQGFRVDLLQPATLDLSLELLPAGWGILLDAVFAQQAVDPQPLRTMLARGQGTMESCSRDKPAADPLAPEAWPERD
jgi:hypothetical protein